MPVLVDRLMLWGRYCHATLTHCDSAWLCQMCCGISCLHALQAEVARLREELARSEVARFELFRKLADSAGMPLGCPRPGAGKWVVLFTGTSSLLLTA